MVKTTLHGYHGPTKLVNGIKLWWDRWTRWVHDIHDNMDLFNQHIPRISTGGA